MLSAFVFVFGMLVGYYGIYPWEHVKFLVVPSDVEVATQDLPLQNLPLQEQVGSPPLAPTPQVLNTSLLNFDVTWVSLDRSMADLAGGLSEHGNGVLSVKRLSGEVWYYDKETNRLFQTRVALPYNNRSDLPSQTVDGRAIYPLRYRSALVLADAEGLLLAGFYSFYNVEEKCRVMRLSIARLPSDALQPIDNTSGIQLDWNHVFSSNPCITVSGESDYLTGWQEGGALLATERGTILFGVGDLGKDGVDDRVPALTQADDSDFGRIFEFDPLTNETKRIAMGLRNPQVLVRDGDNLWATDQGPMGGDELNLIQAGANYGWPEVTFGVNYTDLRDDYREWPPQQSTLGHHPDHSKPAFTWVPSISPSSISLVRGVHPRWENNLLVTGLTGHALSRLIVDGDRVIGEERIPFGHRLRSVLAAHGRIYVLTDLGVLTYLTPRQSQADSSEIRLALDILRKNDCLQCHNHPDWPSLSHVYGARIGSQPGIGYSPALMAKGGVWTPENLSAFLANTNQFAPGTVMPQSVLSESQISEIVGALRTLSPDSVSNR